MQFTLKATIAQIATVALFVTSAVASPTPVAANVVANAELDHWLATTDAKLTFINDVGTTNPLVDRATLNTRVVYCSRRTNNVCGGDCTVYNGNSRCLDAPGTNCLFATTNVGFCDRGGCGGSCNQYSSCGTRLDGGFCYTPGTRSINVPFT
ncbi:hypothetical protein EST38_g11576 [Candolleomyces aberdarensis]|uniref:Uncharacterized protein n=1 Tax=Candolleomyces aberdarensis TaxID=2316362 RepID=A0A4Q2D4K1_9AGAR|nr:hypothetical protein EST38_g11576 [Candolleomyces aberdarensis]